MFAAIKLSKAKDKKNDRNILYEYASRDKCDSNFYFDLIKKNCHPISQVGVWLDCAFSACFTATTQLFQSNMCTNIFFERLHRPNLFPVPIPSSSYLICYVSLDLLGDCL